MAKMAALPATPALEALEGKEIDLKTPEALRDACVAYYKTNPAEYSIRIQLNAGVEEMPIEDATAPWSEDLSQYQEVARLVLPAQQAWDEAKNTYFEDLSFDVHHTLAAHRPLGSINRARLAVYPAMSARRHSENNRPEIVPTSTAEVPA